MTSEDRDSKQAEGSEERRPTVLPAARRPARAVERPPEPIWPLPPRQVSPAKRRIVVVLFSVVLPVAVFALVIAVVVKLDDPKLGKEPVAGGTLYWLADGLVAVQGGAEDEHKAYYLIEAPRESDPRVTLRENGVTVRVSTDEGMRTLSHSVDRSEGSEVVLITFKNYFREAMELEGETEILEKFVAVGGEGASVAQLLYHFRVPSQPAPSSPDSPVSTP